jgi:hypothetical protein
LHLKEVEKEYGWNNSEWNEYKRTNYLYDIKNLLIEMFVEQSVFNWEKTLVITYNYDEHDRISESIIKSWNQDQNAYSIWKTLFQYYSENDIAEEVVQKFENELWINYRREASNFDSHNNITENLLQYWENNNWENYSRQNYLFDEKLNKIQSVQLAWSNFVWDSLSMDTFAYDEPGQLIEQNRKAKQNGFWINDSKFSFNYDEDGNLIIHMFQYWIDSLLINGNINYYEFNDEGKLTQEIEKGWRNESWENNSKVNYEYDLSGNLILKTYQNWVENNWKNTVKYFYNYDDVTNIKENDIFLYNFSLSDNYPNPFNPNTSIDYTIPYTANVELTVYNFLGEEIIKLVNETQNEGLHQLKFEAKNLSSGIYFYQLKVGNIFLKTKKMLIVK